MQTVRELGTVAEEEPVFAVADELAEARPVVEREHRHTGAEAVEDLHRQVEARRRAVQRQAEIGGADEARILLRLEPRRAQQDTLEAERGETTLVLGAPWTVAGDDDRRRRPILGAEPCVPGDRRLDEQIEVLVGAPTGRAHDERRPVLAVAQHR